MRTRQEILKPALELFETKGVTSADYTASAMTAVMEILLDIRELLANPPLEIIGVPEKED